MNKRHETTVIPVNPSREFIQNYFDEGLLHTPGYKIDPSKGGIKLDQNESSQDWVPELKAKVLARLKDRSWHRYPSPYATQLTELIAAYAGVPSDSVLLGPGSNYLLGVLLEAFTVKKNHFILARPSFPFYETYCKYHSIKYKTWDLTDDLEYDVHHLPKLTNNTVVVFASPNNPVGNTLQKKHLIELLKNNPSTIFIADEAYSEFATEQFTDLLAQFDNLIIVRTFSKALASAGIRLGYLLAAPSYISELQKLVFPYLINIFTREVCSSLLQDAPTLLNMVRNVQKTIQRREKLVSEIRGLNFPFSIAVKNSEANFFLLLCKENHHLQILYQHLIDKGIQVRNVSTWPGMKPSLRVTVGTEIENEQFLAALKLLTESSFKGIA